MPWDDGLTGKALAIASTTESPLRVMAGPGTGKSFAMKRRVARLLEEHVPAKRILAVTFTRTAADSLVKDLQGLGIAGCENIRACTLHAYCFALLSQKGVFDFLNRRPRPLVTFVKSKVLQYEAAPMLADIITKEFGARRDCSKRIRAFEAAWARLQSEDPGWPTDPIDAQFEKVLMAWLKFHEAILIGELVPLARKYLLNNPACAALEAHDHVIVDEYQDLNRAEQELIDLLGNHADTAIVGDVDQSIYRFRHANPEGIVEFGGTHADTHDEELDECRRCPTCVVSMADELIRSNYPPGTLPRLMPKMGNPVGHCVIAQWKTFIDEIEGVRDYVRHLVENVGYQPGDILIMTPRRMLGYWLRDEIAAINIPVHSYYHEEALESDEAQVAFTLLTLLANPDDRVALRWWLGWGSDAWRRGEYTRLRTYCQQNGCSPREALAKTANGEITIKGISQLLARHNELQAKLAPLMGAELPDVIEQVIPAGAAGCEVLRDAAEQLVMECDTIQKFVGTLRTLVTQPEVPQDTEFVRVMSLHKAKGLTSKVAIIAGTAQGLIPFRDPDETLDEQEQIEREQRRLFYVAITRCTERLLISSFIYLPMEIAYKLGASFSGMGTVVSAMASPFLPELGPNAPKPVSGAKWKAAGFP